MPWPYFGWFYRGPGAQTVLSGQQAPAALRGPAAQARRTASAGAGGRGACDPALGKILRDVFQRVVRLAGYRFFFTVSRTSGARRRDPPAAGGVFHAVFTRRSRELPSEIATRCDASGWPPPKRRRYRAQLRYQPLLRARHAHVAKPPFLFHRGFGSSERLCGNRPSSRPAMNTTGHSSPLALCMVSSETGGSFVQIVASATSAA